ncbi:Hypothetical_protein [Hexamita inflata]|uniref:Hypothetical_protein n=1 Tax=Hexamita inflata TaxID=28002 RepID=A0ABP1HSZ2_9EUKA
MNRIEGHPSQKVSLSNTKISTTSETLHLPKLHYKQRIQIETGNSCQKLQSTLKLNTTTQYKRKLNNTSKNHQYISKIHQKPTKPFKQNREINADSILKSNSILQHINQTTPKKRISLNTIRLIKQSRQQLNSGNINIQTQDMKKLEEIALKKLTNLCE